MLSDITERFKNEENIIVLLVLWFLQISVKSINENQREKKIELQTKKKIHWMGGKEGYHCNI